MPRFEPKPKPKPKPKPEPEFEKEIEMKKMQATFALCLAICTTAASAQSLIGDAYIANVLVNGSVGAANNDTAQIGPDAIGNWGGEIGYDVEASSITVSSLLNTNGWIPDLAFEFLDLDFLPAGSEIIGVSVINASGAGWDLIDDSDVTFTANSVTIDASKIAGALTAFDQTVTVQLITGPPPPSLIGDAYIANVFVNGSVVGTNNDTALLGPDAIGIWFGEIGYDVEASSITVSSLINTGVWISDLEFEFLDLDFLPAGVEIVGAFITNAAGTGWDLIDDSDVSFTANSVTIDASKSGGALTAFDQTVTVQLITGSGASLIGDDYIANLLQDGAVLGTNNDTALLGPDAFGNWFGQLGYDVEASSITVSSLVNIGVWPTGVAFEFLDLDFLPAGSEIIGVSVINASGAGWDLIDDSDVTFTANSVTIDASKIAGALTAFDQTVTVQLITGPPPPSLIGDAYIANVFVNGSVVGTNNDTALLGPDAIGIWFGEIGYDVEASSITVSSLINTGVWISDLEFEFLDLDFLPAGVEIVGAFITNAAGTGWDQIDDSDVSFTANSIMIDASEVGGVVTALDQTVTIQLITGPAAPPCPGDIADDFGTLGSDGMVGFGDFLALLGLVGPCPGMTPGCPGDIADDFGTLPPLGGSDGMVSFGDFLALLGLVGPCP